MVDAQIRGRFGIRRWEHVFRHVIFQLLGLSDAGQGLSIFGGISVRVRVNCLGLVGGIGVGLLSLKLLTDTVVGSRRFDGWLRQIGSRTLGGVGLVLSDLVGVRGGNHHREQWRRESTDDDENGCEHGERETSGKRLGERSLHIITIRRSASAFRVLT
ncbi:hypothetical protein [Actinomyces ruminicola]|uniref:hypothetical protein n=1 Tax=Actinomyces ruminicola TaxID=332524 RepID=UPI0015A1544D|nr:hypothetical protein [Actinomyces ruminicola]